MNYDNKQLALPAIVETTALFIIKISENAPQTLEEVEANAAKLTDSKKKQYGMLFDAKISILIIRFYSAMMIIFSRKMAVNMIFIS